MNVADLQVHVGYDGADAERGLKNLGEHAGKAGGFLSNAASSMVGFIGAGVVMPAIGSAASFVGSSMFGLSSKLEMAQNGFTNMLGSSEAAKAHLEELKAFAANSPFEFPDVQAASQKLLAMGISAGEVVPTLSSVGNAVAAMGGGKEQIDRVTTAIGQMNAKGKVSAEEMGQLAESGLPAWDMLATSLGKSTAETQKLVSEGKVASSEFLTAFNTEVPKRFGDSMAQQAQTLPGLMSTLKDTVSMGLAGMAGPLTENLKQALTGLSTSLGPLMAALGSAFGPLLGSVGETINMLAQMLTPILTGLAPILGETASILSDALGTALQAIVPVLGQMLLALAPILPMIATLAATIVESLSPVVGALGAALVPVIQALVQGLKPVFDALTPIIPTLVAALMPLVEVVLELLLAFLPLIPPLAQLIATMVRLQTSALMPIIVFIADLATKLITMLMPAIQAIVGWVSKFVSALAAMDFSKIGEMLLGLWDTITEWVSSTMSALPGMVVGLVGSFLSWVGPLLLQLPGKLFSIWWAIESWVLGKIIELPGIMLGLVGSFLSWIGPLVAQLPGGLLSIATTIMEWAMDLPKKVVDWIGDIGGTIVGAIVSGLKTAWNAVADFINDFVPDEIGFSIGPTIDLPDNPLPKFHSGGVVPGTPGAEMFAVLQAGEMVLTQNQQRALLAGGAGSGTVVSGDLTVNVYNGDPNEVVATIERWVRRNGPLPIAVGG